MHSMIFFTIPNYKLDPFEGLGDAGVLSWRALVFTAIVVPT